MSISLSVYSLRVNDVESREEISDLTAIPVKRGKISLIDIFEEALKPHAGKKCKKMIKEKSLVKVKNIKTSDKSYFIKGEFISGKYGYISDIIDSETGETTHSKTQIEAEMLPFSFYLMCSKKQSSGVLIIQNFNQFGIKTTFEELINEHTKIQGMQYRINFNAEVPESIIRKQFDEKFMQKVKKIRFRRNIVPKEIVERFGLIEAKTEDYYAELTLGVKPGKEYNGSIFSKSFDAKPRQDGMLEAILPTEFDFFNGHDIFKIEMDVLGRHRTVDMNNWMSKSIKFDITDLTTDGDTGLPLRKEIDEECLKLAHDVATIKWGNLNGWKKD